MEPQEKIRTITLNGVEYVEKSAVQMPALQVDGMPYVIVRTFSAGVHAGYLQARVGKEVELLRARRLWYWSGAASLSQLACDGVARPEKCKFPCEVGSITLTEAIEIIPCTAKAQKSIAEVPVWAA